MCGLAGVISDPDRERSRDVVSKMMASLCRRGPDGEGLQQWPMATLGHRRLSIFDLSSAGLQPMLSADGRVGVVFNGAIYNFLSLRGELERSGSGWGLPQAIRRSDRYRHGCSRGGFGGGGLGRWP